MATILVVEQDPHIRTWLCGLLNAEGHHVVEARDGREALACVDREQPALMVLDIYLPGMGGFEVILQVRKRAHSLKILVISGDIIDRYNTCETAKLLGAHSAMPEPFGADSFLQRVRSLLSPP
jgi:DNA-binding response OmpR family regulator